MSEEEITEEEIVKETLEFEDREEIKVDLEAAPSVAKAPNIRASGGCHICGRYSDVPVIDGVPQCACYTK